MAKKYESPSGDALKTFEKTVKEAYISLDIDEESPAGKFFFYHVESIINKCDTLLLNSRKKELIAKIRDGDFSVINEKAL